MAQAQISLRLSFEVEQFPREQKIWLEIHVP